MREFDAESQRIIQSSKDIDEALLSYESVEQLRELAGVYRKSGKYIEAFQLYQTIESQLDGCLKIQPAIYKALCLMETDQASKAAKEVQKLVGIIKSAHNDKSMSGMLSVVDSELRDLAEQLVESHESDSALSLAFCRFDLIKALSEDGICRLLLLEKLGLLLQNIAEEISSSQKRTKLKSTYDQMCDLLDDILEEMQNISNVDVKTKCSRVAWFLKYVGFCSDEMEDYQRSSVVYNQAIMIMKTVYGLDACYYKVVGFCYSNLAYVFENTNQLPEAVKVLRHAVDIFHDAVDWTCEEEKSRCISKTLVYLNALKEKLTPKHHPNGRVHNN